MNDGKVFDDALRWFVEHATGELVALSSIDRESGRRAWSSSRMIFVCGSAGAVLLAFAWKSTLFGGGNFLGLELTVCLLTWVVHRSLKRRHRDRLQGAARDPQEILKRHYAKRVSEACDVLRFRGSAIRNLIWWFGEVERRRLTLAEAWAEVQAADDALEAYARYCGDLIQDLDRATRPDPLPTTASQSESAMEAVRKARAKLDGYVRPLLSLAERAGSRDMGLLPTELARFKETTVELAHLPLLPKSGRSWF